MHEPTPGHAASSGTLWCAARECHDTYSTSDDVTVQEDRRRECVRQRTSGASVVFENTRPRSRRHVVAHAAVGARRRRGSRALEGPHGLYEHAVEARRRRQRVAGRRGSGHFRDGRQIQCAEMALNVDVRCVGASTFRRRKFDM